jgi:hypothetical protein
MVSSMKRTVTAEWNTLTYAEKTKVTFISEAPESLPDQEYDVRFDFTADAQFDSLLHFHTSIREYLFVQRGTIRLTLGQEIKMVEQFSGEIEIPPWIPHRWEVLGGSETTVYERTVPRDGRHEMFFRNIFSLCNDYGGLEKLPPLQAIKLFADWDNYPIGSAWWMVYTRPAIIGAVWAIGGVAGLFGYRSTYPEYVSEDSKKLK